MGLTLKFQFLTTHHISSVPFTNPIQKPQSIHKQPFFQPIHRRSFSHLQLKSRSRCKAEGSISNSNGGGGGGVEDRRKYGDGDGDGDEVRRFYLRWGELLLGADRDDVRPLGLVGALAWSSLQVTYRMWLMFWEGFAFCMELGLHSCVGALIVLGFVVFALICRCF